MRIQKSTVYDVLHGTGYLHIICGVLILDFRLTQAVTSSGFRRFTVHWSL